MKSKSDFLAEGQGIEPRRLLHHHSFQDCFLTIRVPSIFMAEGTGFEPALPFTVGWISNPLRYHYSNPPKYETVVLPSTSIITVSGGWIFNRAPPYTNP